MAKKYTFEPTQLDLLTDIVRDRPRWGATHITWMESQLDEARVKILKLESQVKALARRLPGMFFNPVTQEWQEGDERDMAYDAPEHPDSKKLSDADERILRKPKVRIGPDDVT